MWIVLVLRSFGTFLEHMHVISLSKHGRNETFSEGLSVCMRWRKDLSIKKTCLSIVAKLCIISGIFVTRDDSFQQLKWDAIVGTLPF